MNNFDRLLDALNHRYRRRLLVALSESNPQPVEGRLDAGFPEDTMAGVDSNGVATEVEIVHNHLPRLADYGYVSWDQGNGQISKGANWDEIEPLIEILLTHEDDLHVEWL